MSSFVQAILSQNERALFEVLRREPSSINEIFGGLNAVQLSSNWHEVRSCHPHRLD